MQISTNLIITEVSVLKWKYIILSDAQCVTESGEWVEGQLVTFKLKDEIGISQCGEEVISGRKNSRCKGFEKGKSLT